MTRDHATLIVTFLACIAVGALVSMVVLSEIMHTLRDILSVMEVTG